MNQLNYNIMMSLPEKTVEFCENRRVLAQTNQSSLTRNNRCNSGRVITSVQRYNVGPPKLTFFFLMGCPSCLMGGGSLTPRTPSFRTLFTTTFNNIALVILPIYQ